MHFPGPNFGHKSRIQGPKYICPTVWWVIWVLFSLELKIFNSIFLNENIDWKRFSLQFLFENHKKMKFWLKITWWNDPFHLVIGDNNSRPMMVILAFFHRLNGVIEVKKLVRWWFKTPLCPPLYFIGIFTWPIKQTVNWWYSHIYETGMYE